MSLDTDAEEVWSNLKSNIEIFPLRSCKFAVLSMHRRGYKIASALVKLDNYGGMGLIQEIVHYLTYDESSRRYADLTSGQFNGEFHGTNLPRIGIWDEANLPSIYRIIQNDVPPDRVI
jgi:hypothetical protein